MSSMNKTVNVGLSQFAATDTPKWLTDYNADMQLIDEKTVAHTFTESGVQYTVGKNVNTLTLMNGEHVFTNCSGTVNISGDLVKVYVYGSPKLQIVGKTASNWRNVFIDGVASFEVLNTFTDLTEQFTVILPEGTHLGGEGIYFDVYEDNVGLIASEINVMKDPYFNMTLAGRYVTLVFYAEEVLLPVFHR